jgi:hypothetical protein
MATPNAHMNSAPISTHPVVPLQLAALVAAARAAELDGHKDLYQAAASAVRAAAAREANKRSIVGTFLQLAQSGMPHAILPFTADPLTTDVAALEYPRPSGTPLVIYSTASRIDLGYFLCADDDVTYVDRASMTGAGKSALELADLGVPPGWLTELRGMQPHPVTASFSPDAGDALQIVMPTSEAARWRKARTRLTLLKLGPDGAFSRRAIGNLPVPGRTGGESRSTLSLKLSSEQQIELHAASFDGWWMHIAGDPRLDLLAPVPSLEPDDPASPCRIALPMSDQPGLPGVHTTIPTDRTLAHELVARYRWVAPSDVRDWLTMATSHITNP